MTAYGAMISLKNTIHYILHSSHFTLVDKPSLQTIQAANNELQPLQDILEILDKGRTRRSRKKVNEVDGRIKQKIWELEDKLESLLADQILSQFAAAEQEQVDGDGGIRDCSCFSIDLHCLELDVASFIEALDKTKIEYFVAFANMPQEPFSATIGFDYGLTKSEMIGLSDQFQQLKGHLMNGRPGRRINQIVGMGGIGKTTLARELYEDADIVSFYDCRVWVTVTRTMVDRGPQLTQVLQGIVAQLCGVALIQGDEAIGECLKGKKCLIVLDDVWERDVFYYLKNSLPDIRNGLLCILATTRGIDLLANRDIEARFLSEEESKDLLCHKVFGGKDLCPDQLDKAVAKIAKKCEGLPLMIVSVADILSKSQNTEPDYWNDVAEERNSVFTDAYNEISEVLFPSYDYLPQYLKMPFLFMGVFPPDYETPESKLINMLNAEGWFLDKHKTKSLEGSVSDCLYQLCKSRYLVLFRRKSAYWSTLSRDSIYKTCWLHSSWRYVCRREARKNKLYHVLNTLVDGSEEVVKVPIDVGFKLLRELDALQLRFYTFPTEILALVQLKYLALTCNGELPSTISKLFNLRVLIMHPHMNIRRLGAPSYVPVQIWDMKELEHIEILGKSLRFPDHVASLEKLMTLVGVNASISTILKLSRRMPNIRKLGVQIELTPNDDHIDLLSCFAGISTLQSLKILKCSIINPVVKFGKKVFAAPPSSLKLSRGLKKLHLSGMGFPWEYMDVISSLPDLEVLKLRSYAFQGSNWEAPQVRSFPNLKFLRIEDTNLVCLSLSPPYLTHVSIKHCYKLEKIQWEGADRKIELVDCNPLAFTWAKELEPSAYSYNDVTISSSFEKEKPMVINFKRGALRL